METSKCITCGKPKGDFECGLCQSPLCRKCRMFLEEDAFAFMQEVPDELRASPYCQICYDDKVAPQIAQYESDLELARQLFVFFSTGKRAVPTLKKALRTVEVEQCMDRDQTILQLGYLAVKQGFNAIMNTQVVSAKVRNEGYQKLMWSGSALPVQVDGEKMEREYARNFGLDD